jgi:hypothetical protein
MAAQDVLLTRTSLSPTGNRLLDYLTIFSAALVCTVEWEKTIANHELETM